MFLTSARKKNLIYYLKELLIAISELENPEVAMMLYAPITARINAAVLKSPMMKIIT